MNLLGHSSLPPCYPKEGSHGGSHPAHTQDGGRVSHPESDVWRETTAHVLTRDFESGASRSGQVPSPEFGAGGGNGSNGSASRGANHLDDGGCGEDRCEGAVSQNIEHIHRGPPVHTTSSSAVVGGGAGVDCGTAHKVLGGTEKEERGGAGGRSGGGEDVASLSEACRRRRQAACEAGRAGRAEMRELFLKLRFVPAEGGQLLDVVKRLLETGMS